VQAAKAAILLCLTVAMGSASWYLRVRAPENHWRRIDQAGQASMSQGRFGEAERHFTAAIEAARAFGAHDPRLARSLFHQAEALVAQARHSEAAPLLEQALVVHVKALGRDHPESARMRAYYSALRDALDQSRQVQSTDP
jgi:tetratricopeptide (TPR) repeat protein